MKHEVRYIMLKEVQICESNNLHMLHRTQFSRQGVEFEDCGQQGTLTFCRKLWRANSTLTGGGELESGQTAIAFTPLHQLETDGRTGAVQSPTRTWAWTWPTCGWSRTERYR
ncbi:uncharacterized protein LOC135586274 isoform X2 [Musa acuminata AAA Group]|uniref:uncharacterized protein LOC103969858 isoform X3 n=1 Tax=Musa acuminata AAA Group TaxID=214697 RepID=UPI0031CF4D3D